MHRREPRLDTVKRLDDGQGDLALDDDHRRSRPGGRSVAGPSVSTVKRSIARASRTAFGSIPTSVAASISAAGSTPATSAGSVCSISCAARQDAGDGIAIESVGHDDHDTVARHVRGVRATVPGDPRHHGGPRGERALARPGTVGVVARGSRTRSTTRTGVPRRCATATSTVATATRRSVRSRRRCRELEGAEESLAFASGMGAIASTVLALCSSGSHVVAQRQLYAGTLAFLQGPCARLGIETTFVDVATPGAFADAVQPGRTMVVLAETPSNPRLELADLDELGAIKGPFTVVDSTFATPLGQRPARPRRRHLAPFGHEGDRRPQRRHARRDLGRCRPAGRDLGVRGAARRHAVAVRCAQRAARRAHARRAHPTAERVGAIDRGDARRPPGRRRDALPGAERAPAVRRRETTAPPVRNGAVVRRRHAGPGSELPRPSRAVPGGDVTRRARDPGVPSRDVDAREPDPRRAGRNRRERRG